LPDTIQFGTGNQIINRYAASRCLSGGRKLGTEYFTRVTNLAVPLITGQVINQTYSLNVINQNGTAYIDNKEYTTLNGNPALTAINRVHNAEGYTDNLLNPYGPFYYYDRKDHLGNIREVWRAAGFPPAGTVQYTQYYPSGLPWASNSIDNPITQPYKYNGKEFVEMNGYDTYDYGARGYYPAMGRFTSMDPLAELYYNVSPYAYCMDNPINKTDPDGRGVNDNNLLPEVTVTAPDLSKKNDNSSTGQFISNEVRRNEPQIPRITPPSPSFNLPTNTNTNNVTTENQTKSKDKEMEEALKKVKAMILLLGITDGSIEVVEKIVNGTPTIVVLFKDGAALANLGSVLKQFKDALGPIGFGLNEIADVGKYETGGYDVKDFMLSGAFNFAATKIPAVAIALVFIYVISTKPVPVNYQNPVCPVDHTNVIPLYLTH